MAHDIGEPVFVSHQTAAALHCIDGFPLTQPFHFTVPRGRNIVRIAHVVHTTTRLDAIDRESTKGFAVTSPTRTLIDLSGSTSVDQTQIALDGMLRDGLTTESFLHRRITDLRSKGRYGTPRLLEAIERSEAGRGCHSWLEREYQRIITDAGLPLPLSQQVTGRRGTTLIRVDFAFPGTPVVVEVLGYRWHRTTAQMNIDAARLNELVLAGKVPLQFTYQQVVSDPAGVLTSTRRALEPFHPESVSPHRPTQRL
ncbi:MAG: hypothetical protein ACKPDI_11635 [Actinomycetota bacterium]